MRVLRLVPAASGRAPPPTKPAAKANDQRTNKQTATTRTNPTQSKRKTQQQAKAFGICNALGSIGFAYSSAIVLLEVEDTLREPPAAAASMKKTVNLA